MSDILKCGGFEFARDPTRDDNRLESLELALGNSIVCDSLSVDVAEAELYSKALLPIAFSSADKAAFTTTDGSVFCVRSGKDLRTIPYGTPVEYYRNGKLSGKFFKQSIQRTGKTAFELSATSSIGLLEYMQHRGGLYRNVPFETVLADILGGVIPYTVDDALKSVLVLGWLPYASKRSNLQQLLMATGASVRKDANFNVVFTFLDAGESKKISTDSIYNGGSVAGGSPATGVDVTSHAFIELSTDNDVTLYDNTDGSMSSDQREITFSNPVHDLAASGGLVIHESGANYAVVSGIGVLTGKEYTHQTDVVSLRLDSAPGKERIISVSNCTLVSILNVENVSRRILSYYSASERISVDIEAGEHRPGDSVELLNPFDEMSRGLVESMDINVSRTLKAKTSIITGYTPTGFGNFYNHVLVVTQSGTVTIPAEAKGKAQLVLISGGHGGSSGYAGAVGSGKTKSDQSGSNAIYRSKWFVPPGPALGGKAGTPGGGARILRVTLNDVVGGQTALNVNIGAGGLGGLFTDGENAPGQSGGDTTVGDYTTAGAQETATGYYDPINGVLYGAPGGEGIPGGAGGGYDESSEGNVIPAESVTGFGQTFSGGTSVGMSQSIEKTSGRYDNGYGYKEATAWGGYGGGAAYGAAGESGTLTGAAVAAGSDYASAKGAPGGPGATALPPPVPSTPGTGGFGGNGGGGAGACGASMVQNNYSSSQAAPTPYFSVAPNTMTAGNGSDGGDGADGVLLIYY